MQVGGCCLLSGRLCDVCARASPLRCGARSRGDASRRRRKVRLALALTRLAVLRQPQSHVLSAPPPWTQKRTPRRRHARSPCLRRVDSAPSLAHLGHPRLSLSPLTKTWPGKGHSGEDVLRFSISNLYSNPNPCTVNAASSVGTLSGRTSHLSLHPARIRKGDDAESPGIARRTRQSPRQSYRARGLILPLPAHLSRSHTLARAPG